jgi:hypothetical protein
MLMMSKNGKRRERRESTACTRGLQDNADGTPSQSYQTTTTMLAKPGSGGGGSGRLRATASTRR